MSAVEWFERMQDIPGVQYTPPVPLERAAIPGHDSRPEVRRLDVSGRDYLWWGVRATPPEPGEDPQDAGWTSLDAPVTEHLREALDGSDVAPTELLARLWEALELPGTGKDYHKVLARVLARIQASRVGNPETLASVEQVAWVDVRLMLAYPEAVLAYDESGAPRYFSRSANAFRTLHELYVHEGFLVDAFRVVDLEAQQFGRLVRAETPVAERFSPTKQRDELRDRLEAIHNESIS